MKFFLWFRFYCPFQNISLISSWLFIERWVKNGVPGEKPSYLPSFSLVTPGTHSGERPNDLESELLTISCQRLKATDLPVVWSHPTVRHSNILCDHLNLVDTTLIIQHWFLFLLCCQDNTICSWQSNNENSVFYAHNNIHHNLF